MKRFLVTILSILYLASAMGATVEIHYCMGKGMGANFVHKEDDKCRKCGMNKSKSKGCCKDEHKTFKTSDHQQTKVTFDFSLVPVSALPVNYSEQYFAPLHSIAISSSVKAHAPPDLYAHCPLYLQVRNIRI